MKYGNKLKFSIIAGSIYSQANVERPLGYTKVCKVEDAYKYGLQVINNKVVEL